MTETWSHHCTEVDDHYGEQIVAIENPCPFCGKKESEVSHDSQ